MANDTQVGLKGKVGEKLNRQAPKGPVCKPYTSSTN